MMNEISIYEQDHQRFIHVMELEEDLFYGYRAKEFTQAHRKI